MSHNLNAVQQKILAYGRLVGNIVMFHNVANMTKILNDFQSEGVAYTKEDLSILSAYLREHLNRYGIFDLSLDKQIMPLNFSIDRELKE